MISLVYFFWTMIIAFACVGWMRGWGREIVVAVCAIIGLVINTLFRRYVPMVSHLTETDLSLLWFRTIVLTILVYVGYEVINDPAVASKTAAAGAVRDRLLSTLFGMVLGAFNGYLLVGSLIYYVVVADFPFPSFLARPADPALIQTTYQMMLYMPPQVLGEPGIYFAALIAIAFIILVFSFEEGIRA